MVQMVITKTNTHAGPPLGSRWAQKWAYMWAEQLVRFWSMLPKVTLTNKSTSEIPLPVFLIKSIFDDTLLSTPLTLNEYITQYKCDKEIFDLKERHDIDELEIKFVSKNFFTNNFIIDIFIFVAAIRSVISTLIIIYAICKHNKLRALVTSLAFQQVKEVKVEEISEENYKCKCAAQFYIILALSIIIIGLVIFMILQVRRIKLC